MVLVYVPWIKTFGWFLGGNLRARGEAATGNVWGVDPACYLTDQEIGLV